MLFLEQLETKAIFFRKSTNVIKKKLNSKLNNFIKFSFFIFYRFELLETGMWPSFADITELISKGYDFYKQLDENP